MTDALMYWVEEFNIDGYRCDVAGMIPIDFWDEVRSELDKIKPVFMLAEWDTPEMHDKAFEMTYDWGLHKLMNGIYKGEKSSSDLKEHIIKDQKLIHSMHLECSSLQYMMRTPGMEPSLKDLARLLKCLQYL